MTVSSSRRGSRPMSAGWHFQKTLSLLVSSVIAGELGSGSRGGGRGPTGGEGCWLVAAEGGAHGTEPGHLVGDLPADVRPPVTVLDRRRPALVQSQGEGDTA